MLLKINKDLSVVITHNIGAEYFLHKCYICIW